MATRLLIGSIILAAMSATLIVGAFHPSVIAASQVVGGIATSAQMFLNLINRPFLGTPPWRNTAVSGVGPVSNLMATEQALTQGQREILKDIVGTALWYLNTKPQCREYIQGGTSQNPQQVLADLQTSNIRYFHGRQFTSAQPPEVAAARGGVWTNSLLRRGPYSWDSTKRIVLGFSFFTPNVGNYTDFFEIDTKQARVLIVLHELRHVVTQTGHPTGNADDTYNWNLNIMNKCIK